MAAPTVASVSPQTGDTVGGTVLYIMGTNFNGVTGVTVDGVACPTFEAISGTGNERLFAVAPAGTVGAKDIVVTNADGSGTGTGLFTYTTPNAVVYQLHLWDDCCHLFHSTDSGTTFVEGATPGSPTIPAPQDPGIDPLNVGTLLEQWDDAAMAINDGDYTTLVGFMQNYRGEHGIVGISLDHGLNQTYTLVDPYPGEPGFNDDGDNQYYHARGAASAGAETILVATDLAIIFPVVDFYPRISRDGGETWDDVTDLDVNVCFTAVCFGSEVSQHMYIKPSPANMDNGINPAYIRKSTDWGVTWTNLTGGPDYQGLSLGDAGKCRLRCSADGQTVIMIAYDTNFWISQDAGANWTNIDFKTLTDGGGSGSLCDCAISPDGETIIVVVDQTFTAGNGFPGFYPAVFVSTDGGDNFTDVTDGLEYPNWFNPLAPTPPAPTYLARGCCQCAVSPDGLGMLMTFGSHAILGPTQPDGLQGSILAVNVSYDAGQTWKLITMNADPYENSSVLGFFTAVYITNGEGSGGGGDDEGSPDGTTSPVWHCLLGPVFDDD